MYLKKFLKSSEKLWILRWNGYYERILYLCSTKVRTVRRTYLAGWHICSKNTQCHKEWILSYYISGPLLSEAPCIWFECCLVAVARRQIQPSHSKKHTYREDRQWCGFMVLILKSPGWLIQNLIFSKGKGQTISKANYGLKSPKKRTKCTQDTILNAPS